MPRQPWRVCSAARRHAAARAATARSAHARQTRGVPPTAAAQQKAAVVGRTHCGALLDCSLWRPVCGCHAPVAFAHLRTPSIALFVMADTGWSNKRQPLLCGTMPGERWLTRVHALPTCRLAWFVSTVKSAATPALVLTFSSQPPGVATARSTDRSCSPAATARDFFCALKMCTLRCVLCLALVWLAVHAMICRCGAPRSYLVHDILVTCLSHRG